MAINPCASIPVTASTQSIINLSASPIVNWINVPIRFNTQEDKTPRRLGGKEYSMKEINKLRYS